MQSQRWKLASMHQRDEEGEWHRSRGSLVCLCSATTEHWLTSPTLGECHLTGPRITSWAVLGVRKACLSFMLTPLHCLVIVQSLPPEQGQECVSTCIAVTCSPPRGSTHVHTWFREHGWMDGCLCASTAPASKACTVFPASSLLSTYDLTPMHLMCRSPSLTRHLVPPTYLMLLLGAWALVLTGQHVKMAVEGKITSDYYDFRKRF